MKAQPFNDNWLFGKADGNFDTLVTLPHDAMLYEPRSAGNTAGLGYFPGGSYRYEKRWVPDASFATQLLEFEGVYGETTVTINGVEAALHCYGYTGFYVDLVPYLRMGEENVIEVLADNSLQPNSRWYSGSGIYRNVTLWRGGAHVLPPDAVRLKTLSLDPARLEVTVEAEGETRTEFLRQGEVAAYVEGSGVCTIENAALWSAETPELYQVRTTLYHNGDAADVSETSFGIRTLAWDARRGLQLNGKTVKLRGACIHHDNGVLGACAFPEAEERKIRILKEAGFNAVRSAHNPCSKALLDACDRLGMYVMDEAFDCWILPKNSQDYAKDFFRCYREDLRTMVVKDRNHPAVILYSIGNETPESAKPEGVELMRSMREVILGLDNTRPITCGISITQNIDWKSGISSKEKYMGGVEKEDKGLNPASRIRPWMLPLVNRIMGSIYRKMNAPLATDTAEEAIREACATLDIAGYNYGEIKTEYDDTHNPDRIVVSSETHHTEIFENWARIMANPRLVGDFMWVGWDYIGEAGVGALGFPSRGSLGFDKPYPHLTSGSGIIDITGFLRPEVYWTQMVWGQRTAPVIAVEPLEFAGEKYMMTYWNDTEAVSSWTWPGFEGKKATVKVYTPGERVELFLNSRHLGTKKVSRNMAVFRVPYRPGTLKAITYDKDGGVQDTELVTASEEKRLLLELEEKTLKPGGLGHLRIAVADEDGVVYAAPEHEIRVSVEGAGELLGLGSGAICTEDSFVSGSCHTFHGRALAVIRAMGTGEICVKVTTGNLTAQSVFTVEGQING